MIRASLLLLCLFINSAGYAATPVEDTYKVPLLNPTLAQRQTQKLILDNGMKVYLISDPGAEQSAASLTVRVGSWDEPTETLGVAHFLEHMLFLGTSKYPEENGYQLYLQNNGGQANAMTAPTHTSYLFSVNHNAFEDAVDRFSWFFREPLFNPSGIQREMNAVDQEYAQGREDDRRRAIAVHQALANKQHPESRFHVGSLETLGKISQDALKEFYQSHYSANLMHLVIYSNRPLDELQKIAVEHFEPIQNNKREQLRVTVPFLDPALGGQMVHVAPMKDLRSLEMLWELPSKFAYMKDSQPGSIVSHLLGHEGENSLLAQLKREGLAQGLSASTEPFGSDQMLMSLDIELTPDGLKNLDQVVERCFQAIEGLKKEPIPQYVFDEVRRMSEISYQFQERTGAFRTVYRHAFGMMHEDFASYPIVSQIIQKFDPEAIQELLTALKPQTCQYMLLADPSKTGVSLDTTEKWYGTEYTVKSVREKTLQQWAQATPNPTMGIPPANPFIPQNLTLVYSGTATDPTVTPVPEKIVAADDACIYFCQDTQYLTPEITWQFRIKVPTISPEDPRSFVMGDLYALAVTHALSSYSYPAEIAGLSYAVTRTDEGILLLVNGYSEKPDKLLNQILQTLKTVDPSEEDFQRFVDTVERDYKNVGKDGPLEIAGEELRKVLYKDYVDYKEKQHAIQKVERSHLIAFRDELFEKSYVEGMMTGNMQRDDALRVWKALQSALGSRPFPIEVHYKKETVVLPVYHGPYFLRETTKQQGNAVVLMLQEGPMDYQRKAIHEMLTNWIQTPFYDSLRTKQQTAYIVWNWDSEVEQELFSFFAVQSNSHEGRDLLARFELVIEDFLKELRASTTPPAQFETIRASFVEKLSQPPRTLLDMAKRLDALAFEYDGEFDRIQKRIAGFEKLTWEEFLPAADAFYGRNNKQRLAIMIDGEIPRENTFQYAKMRSGVQLRKISDYKPKRDITAL